MAPVSQDHECHFVSSSTPDKERHLARNDRNVSFLYLVALRTDRALVGNPRQYREPIYIKGKDGSYNLTEYRAMPLEIEMEWEVVFPNIDAVMDYPQVINDGIFYNNFSFSIHLGRGEFINYYDIKVSPPTGQDSMDMNIIEIEAEVKASQRASYRQGLLMTGAYLFESQPAVRDRPPIRRINAEFQTDSKGEIEVIKLEKAGEIINEEIINKIRNEKELERIAKNTN